MKTVSLLLRILAVLGAVAAIALFFMTQGKVEDLQQQQRQNLSAKSSLHGQIDELTSARNELEGRFRGLEADLATTRTEFQNARSQLAQNRREMTTVQADLRRAREEVQNLEGQNTRLKEEIIATRATVPEVDAAQVEQYRERIAQLTRRVEEMQGQLDRRPAAGAVVPGSEAEPTVAQVQPEVRRGDRPRSASVLRTNPSLGLVVLDSGSDQGLRQNMEFEIARHLGPKVKVRLSNVQSDVSVANILPGQGNVSFEQGQSVTLFH